MLVIIGRFSCSFGDCGYVWEIKKNILLLFSGGSRVVLRGYCSFF